MNMISISEVQNSENSGLTGNSRKAKVLSSSNIKGNGKTPTSSVGLTLRTANTDHRVLITPALKKPVAATKPKIDEDDDKEYMPNVTSEQDDYADILPFDERPNGTSLRRILRIPLGQQGPEKENMLTHNQPPSPFRFSHSDFDVQMIAEEVIDEFEACSLDGISLTDADSNDKDGIRNRH